MKPDPNRLTVLRSLPTVLSVSLGPFSTGSPSKSTNGRKSESRNTFNRVVAAATDGGKVVAGHAGVDVRRGDALEVVGHHPSPALATLAGLLRPAGAVQRVEGGHEDVAAVFGQLVERELAGLEVSLADVSFDGRLLADNSCGGIPGLRGVFGTSEHDHCDSHRKPYEGLSRRVVENGGEQRPVFL